MIPIPRTPHQLTPNVKLLQKVALVHAGKVLLVQRDMEAASRPGKWDLPGGNSEWPTDVFEPTTNLHQRDASREVFEETGLHIEPAEFNLKNLVLMETFFDPDKQVFTVLLGWKIQLPNNLIPESIQLSHEHTLFEWANLDQAGDFDFGGTKGEFVPRIIKNAL